MSTLVPSDAVCQRVLALYDVIVSIDTAEPSFTSDHVGQTQPKPLASLQTTNLPSQQFTNLSTGRSIDPTSEITSQSVQVVPPAKRSNLWRRFLVAFAMTLGLAAPWDGSLDSTINPQTGGSTNETTEMGIKLVYFNRRNEAINITVANALGSSADIIV